MTTVSQSKVELDRWADDGWRMPDQLWDRMWLLVESPSIRSRISSDPDYHRRCIDGVLFVLRTTCPFSRIPSTVGRVHTVEAYYRRRKSFFAHKLSTLDLDSYPALLGVRQRLSNLNLLFKERQEAAWARGREASRAGTTPSTPHHGNSRPLGRTLDDNVFGKSAPQRCPHCGSGRPHIYIDTEIGAWACFSCGYRVHLFTPFTGRDKERRNSRDSMSCAPEPYTTNLKLR